MKPPIVLHLLVVLLLLAVSSRHAAAQWNPPERITGNSVDEFLYPGSLAIDGNDLLHAVWMQNDPVTSQKKILYLEGSSGSWGQPEEIPTSDLHGPSPDLAVHTDGTAHVVWFEGISNTSEIFYATKSSGTWIVEGITGNATEDLDPAAAVDGDGFPHIAWIGYDPSSGEGKVFYGNRTAGSWGTEVLANSSLGAFWTGANPTISVSRLGAVQITYRGGDYGMYKIHQATNATGSWVIKTLSSGNANDSTSSVRTDFYNICYLAVSGSDGWGFPGRVYTTQSTDQGITWSSMQLASGGWSATNPVLGIDWNGNSHIAWEETNGNFYTGTIFFTTNRTGSWTTEKITGSVENLSPSIAVDGSARAHIIYVNVATGSSLREIYYLSNASPTVTMTLTPRGSTTLPRGSTLSMDLAATNETGAAVSTDFWITAIVASTGTEITIPPSLLGFPNPFHGSIPAGATINGTVSLQIPPAAPVGLVTLAGSLGDFFGGTYLDRAAVSIRVVP